MQDIKIFSFENNNFRGFFSGLLKKKKVFDKSNIRILFIDDEFDDFPVIQNLIDAGWAVEGIGDVQNIDDDIVKRSHIIFVDYKGVGQKLSESEQGIGLIKLLKNNYKDSKRVGLYSGHNRFSLGDDFDIADFRLSKNTDTREFIEVIQNQILKLK